MYIVYRMSYMLILSSSVGNIEVIALNIYYIRMHIVTTHVHTQTHTDTHTHTHTHTYF